PNYFTRLLGSHYNGESLHPQYTTPPPQVQGSSQFQERQGIPNYPYYSNPHIPMYPHYEYFNPAMQQLCPPQSMPTPPADTRPDDMVESNGMSNDESRNKWTIEDDKLLASSYLIISTDSVKGYHIVDDLSTSLALQTGANSEFGRSGNNQIKKLEFCPAKSAPGCTDKVRPAAQ
ncbi:hypothetical protein LINPERHAP2_LOCUS15885, partial [Linum perenne]